ncbi:hypothetical protein [Arenibacter lacus]|uniref:hypothetical protein n=1 Tax=Arenibacter lacus TaxID=2608629 RepID=UPI00123D7B28|nr:hypothetical protein [Arenibacter lacus]
MKTTLHFTKIVIAITSLLVASCSNVMNKPMNLEDFDKVKEEISKNSEYTPEKSAYITDHLKESLGFLEMGKTMGKAMRQKIDASVIPTFKEEIADLSVAYDSIRNAKLSAKRNNEKLENFTELVAANTISLDKYTGYLSMNLKFHNEFDKEVLYIILNYKYINKYDSKFFDEKTKLTDEVAGDFKGEVEVMTTEKYNDVANFMYTKVPTKASQELQDELGEEAANKKVKNDFLMEGLEVKTLGIVFKDKTELFYEDAEWEYLESL